MRHMADYSQKEKELEREHLEKLVKEEDRSIKPMKWSLRVRRIYIMS